jgi:hypothetical protein
MLKAYTDGSHTTKTAFVLAGYIAPAENWAAFSDDWQGLLDLKPPLKRFKMAEAHAWSEQQWTERLPQFYRTIEKHVSAGIAIIIPYPEYTKIFGREQYAKNPYHVAFISIILQLAKHQKDLQLTEPVDFVFDKGNDDRIAKAWEGFVAKRPEEERRLLGKRPIFGDDVEMKPLQAADLLAWWRRRNFEKRLDQKLHTRKAPWKKTRELLYLDLEMTEKGMQEMYDGLYGKKGG